MIYTKYYVSPLGRILLSVEEGALTGLWFDDGRYFADAIKGKKWTDVNSEEGLSFPEADNEIFKETEKWLDLYFEGKNPDFVPNYRLTGSDFRKRVCEIMLEIPYGKTITYGDIADTIARERGIERMSAQAVGGAVGHNPISIIVPCHRVVGTNGSLTGYGGGMNRKVALLSLEGHEIDSEFTVPTKGTAI